MKRALIIITSIMCGLAICALSPAANADERRAGSEPVLVGPGGGEFTVTTHPSLITSLFLGEPVKQVLASDQKNFTVRKLGNAVAVRPRVVNRALRANLIITTATMRLTILLRVTDDAKQADAQVVFRKASVERDLQKRIDAEVKRRMAGERARLKNDVERAIARRVYTRYGQRVLHAIERNNANVIVMVPRVVWVGNDAYVFFRIHNRSGRAYQLARVRIVADKRNRAGTVVIVGGVAKGPVLSRVNSGDKVSGLVVVRGAAKLKRKRLSLSVAEAGGKRSVAVEEIDLP